MAPMETPLPGTSVNRFNRGLGKEDLRRAVGAFNQKIAGGRTPRNQPIPMITLTGLHLLSDAAAQFGDYSLLR